MESKTWFYVTFYVRNVKSTRFALSAEAISMIATRRPHPPLHIHKFTYFFNLQEQNIYKTLLIYNRNPLKKVSETQNHLQFRKEIPLKCFYKNPKKADYRCAS